MGTKDVRWDDLEVANEEADLVFKIAQENKWEGVGFFGHGKMIEGIVDVGEWRLFPANLYHNTIPPWAMQRVFTLIHSGVHIKGVVIADDLKKYQEKPKRPEPVKLPDLTNLAKFLIGMLGVLIHVALVVGVVLVELLISVISWDPYVVVVLEDGTWLSLAFFFD
jgi:hypothetical protein